MEIESYNITSPDNTPIESSRCVSRVESVFSLVEDRCILSFDPLAIPFFDNVANDFKGCISEKVTYVFNGAEWIGMLYSTTYGDGRVLTEDKASISKNPPLVLSKMMAGFYSGKNMFFNNIILIESQFGLVTIGDVLKKKPEENKFKVSASDDGILISSDDDSTSYNIAIDLSLNAPILKRYEKVYKANKDFKGLKKTITFEGVNDDLAGVPLPKTIRHVVYDGKKDGGYCLIVTVKSVKLVGSESFDKMVPQIPVGWTISDEEKGITYKKAETKEEILKSIQSSEW